MNQIKIALVLSVFFLLVGCGGSRSDRDEPVSVHFPPEIYSFDLVDSYGLSSEDNPFVTPALNPYLSDGLFEIYWDVEASEDYTVELRINDRPSFLGSRLIATDYCGVGLPCDELGAFWCDYRSDFGISCDVPEEPDPGRFITYFDDWVFSVPENLFLIFDVCDTVTDSCEFQVVDLLLE